MKNKIILTCSLALCSGLFAMAQESTFQQDYRSKVLEYNQDLKAAKQNVLMQESFKKTVNSDFKPKLVGGAHFNYTGNPYELRISDPRNAGQSLTFESQDMQYGVGLSLIQPIYTGGSLKGESKKATHQTDMAKGQVEETKNNIIYEADLRYWNTVAQQELVGVAEAFRESVQKLVDISRQRVELDYADKNDLLMAEVKLNDADYQLLRTNNNANIALMSLYSFANITTDEPLAIDNEVIGLKDIPAVESDVESIVMRRPEMMIAQKYIDIQQSNKKISNSRYLPQLSVGIDGSYASPGYNFKKDMDLNYSVFAKLSVPIFEWGKKRNTNKALDFSIEMAKQRSSKVEDNLSLEIRTAYYAYSQAVNQVNLTESSLMKAQESELLTLQRYKEGSVSIVEVLNSQMYHLQAKTNYIQSKLNAQVMKSEYERATVSYTNLPEEEEVK